MTDGIPEVGDRLSFVPASFIAFEDQRAERLRAPVMLHGEVVYVNREHGYYRVRAPLPGGGDLFECFKF